MANIARRLVCRGQTARSVSKVLRIENIFERVVSARQGTVEASQW